MKKIAQKKNAVATKARPRPGLFANDHLALLGIAAAALLCDWNSWGHQFVIDDLPYIIHNRLIQDPANFFRIFLEPVVPHAATQGLMAMYRPLTQLSFGMTYWLAGPDPNAFHLVNRLLHVLICVVIFWIFRRLAPRLKTAALVTSLLFAVHPVQTEAVTYLEGRSDILALLFFLLGWLAFVRLRSRADFSGRDYALSALCYALALLSKESALTWLGVLLLTELVFFSDCKFSSVFKRLREAARLYAGYVAVTAAFLLLRFHVLKGAFTGAIPFEVNPLAHSSLSVRVLTGLKILFEYLGQFLWPAHFSPDYSYNQIPLVTHWASGPAMWVLALAALFIAALILTFRRAPSLFFGLGFFCVTYSVVSNLIIPIGTIRADRLLYMPAVGMCWAVGVLAEILWEKYRSGSARKFLATAFVLLLLVLAARTVRRNADWKDNRSLYLADINPLPNSSKLLNTIGGQLLQQGEAHQAEVCFRKSLAVGHFDPEAVELNLGAALRMQGDFVGAKRQYEAVLEKNPRNTLAHYNLGNLFFAQEKYEAAAAEYRRVLEIDPQLAAAQTNLDVTLQKIRAGQTH